MNFSSWFEYIKKKVLTYFNERLSTERSVKTSQMIPDRCGKTRCFNVCPLCLSCCDLLVGGEVKSHEASDVSSSQIISASCVFHLHLYKLLQLWSRAGGWGYDTKKKSARVCSGASRPVPGAARPPSSAVCIRAVMTFTELCVWCLDRGSKNAMPQRPTAMLGN